MVIRAFSWEKHPSRGGVNTLAGHLISNPSTEMYSDLLIKSVLFVIRQKGNCPSGHGTPFPEFSLSKMAYSPL